MTNEDTMLPHYKDIEEPLLEEIRRRGGSTQPSTRRNGLTVYGALAKHFDLTSADLGESVYEESGNPRSKWENMVRWARNELVKKGKLDGSRRGIWRLKVARDPG